VPEKDLTFASLLRQLRAAARLTQEELAEAACLSPRSVSDLERGVNRTARKTTAQLLADALSIAEPLRAVFIAVARGRAPATEISALRPIVTADLGACGVMTTTASSIPVRTRRGQSRWCPAGPPVMLPGAARCGLPDSRRACG
jgi:transcriptional regulator with XRE-family HTH domain